MVEAINNENNRNEVLQSQANIDKHLKDGQPIKDHLSFMKSYMRVVHDKDPLVKRELFAVSLRKERKITILSAKRKLLVEQIRPQTQTFAK